MQFFGKKMWLLHSKTALDLKWRNEREGSRFLPLKTMELSASSGPKETLNVYNYIFSGQQLYQDGPVRE